MIEKRYTDRDYFNLLVLADGQNLDDSAVIECNGSKWVLKNCSVDGEGKPGRAYTCISYSCGNERIAHPFGDGRLVSRRIMPVFETTIQVEQTGAIWLDAFCVPTNEPARTACLRKMGEIYRHASLVIVVLSKSCLPAIKEIRTAGEVSESAMLALAADDWVTRIWTYQEMVNSNNVRFVCEGQGNVWADGEEILNHVGFAIHNYKKKMEYNGYKFQSVHPRIDSLESLVLDWRIAAYSERSAYQVLCNVAHRDCRNQEDYFYAITGAIGLSTPEMNGMVADHPAEFFMRVCEKKGDYSFIYTIGTRDSALGKSWRPVVSERFLPVFACSSWGEGQSADVCDGYIQLNNMVCMSAATLSADTRSFLMEWLQDAINRDELQDLSQRILHRLRQADFTGTGDSIETENGYFFVQSAVLQAVDVVVAVSAGIRMSLGAPGLVLSKKDASLYECVDVGIFVGQVPKSGQFLKIA